MPELPEVETVANGVQQRVQGRRVVSVWTSGKPQTFKSPEPEIVEALTGGRVVSVRRVGKTIVMTIERGGDERLAAFGDGEARRTIDSAKNQGRMAARKKTAGMLDAPQKVEFLIHLGMTGRLLVSQPEVPLPPHTHAVLALDDGREVRFVDPRRFGRLSIHSGGRQPTTDKALPATSYTGPGREPLSVTLEDFIELFHGRKTPIKAALLNQSLLHGVGNIYADEALFRAGVRPRRQSARLTRAELTRLRAGLIEVLRQAIKLGGSSVSDYVDADGVRGFFQLRHKVYRRTGQPCQLCGTPIRKITVAGRSTHFCPFCQR